MERGGFGLPFLVHSHVNMVVLLGFRCKFPAKLIHLNMKTFSLLAGFALCTTAVLAQRPADFNEAMMPQPASAEEANASRQAGVKALENGNGSTPSLDHQQRR